MADGNTTQGTADAASPVATPDGGQTPQFVIKEDELANLSPEQRQVVEARLKVYEQGWTKKTQDLAEIRKATETREGELRQSVEENKGLAQELRDLQTELKAQGKGPDDPAPVTGLENIDPNDLTAIQKIVQNEMAPMHQLISGLASNTLDAQTVQTVDAYLKEPGNEHFAPHRDAVIALYREKGGTPDDLPVDVFFKAFHYEELSKSVDEARKSGELSALEGVANATRRSVPSGSAPSPVELVPGANRRETWERAKAALGKVAD